MWMIAYIVRFLFPSTCFVCRKKETVLCDRCLRLLRRSLSVPEPFIVSAFDFRDRAVKRAIHAIKYYHRTDLIAPFAIVLAEDLQKRSLPPCSIIPIPMPRRRKLMRGYNQAELIAEELGTKLSLPIRSDILLRSGNPTRQATISDRQSRLLNQKGSFVVQHTTPGMTVLLVDDVTTTGATLLEAKKVLEKSGMRVIYAATLAH
jgi:ComF family protein